MKNKATIINKKVVNLISKNVISDMTEELEKEGVWGSGESPDPVLIALINSLVEAIYVTHAVAFESIEKAMIEMIRATKPGD